MVRGHAGEFSHGVFEQLRAVGDGGDSFERHGLANAHLHGRGTRLAGALRHDIAQAFDVERDDGDVGLHGHDRRAGFESLHLA